MIYCLDTEFIESGHEHPIELLSIGVAASDGRQYYAEVLGANTSRASPWVRKNVLPFLGSKASRKGLSRTRLQIRDDLLEFCSGEPVFWGYFADYDWVLFAQLWGAMVDLPSRFPMYCLDLKQLMDQRGVQKQDLPTLKGRAHHALCDAVWVLDALRHLGVAG